MKTVKLSSKGQIVIPKLLRNQMALKEGVELSVALHGQTLTLRKAPSKSWHRWKGALKGTTALQEHEQEHRQEIESDAQEP